MVPLAMLKLLLVSGIVVVVVVVVSTSLLFQENHVDTCEFLRFNTLRLNTCTPPISSSYIVLAIKCFPIHHDKHATNFNLCTLVYTSS